MFTQDFITGRHKIILGRLGRQFLDGHEITALSKLISGFACNNNYTAVAFNTLAVLSGSFAPSCDSGLGLIGKFLAVHLCYLLKPWYLASRFTRKFSVENPLLYSDFRPLPDNSKVLIAT